MSEGKSIPERLREEAAGLRHADHPGAASLVDLAADELDRLYDLHASDRQCIWTTFTEVNRLRTENETLKARIANALA